MALALLFGVATWMRLRAYEPVEVARVTTPLEATAAREELPVVREGFAAGASDRLGGAAGEAVIDFDGDAGSRSAREQRYRELLQATPAAGQEQPSRGGPADAADAASPSLFERVVAPITNALGIGRKEPTRAPQRASPPPREAPQPQRPADTASDRTRRDTDARNQQELDPDTDVTPPQLLSAEFTPPEVHDGEQTVLAVVITDNLSGVRGVSGVVQSPSGSLQGFACQREGETNRFVAHINVPKEAPEGVWQVKYLTLTDNAANSVNLSQTQGGLPPTASFRVISSSSDATGPVLQAVWLDKVAMRAGERNAVFVTAEDDKAGVARVSGVFVSPSKNARIGFGCRAGATGAWECPVSPPACLDCGLWRLEQIQLHDKANNMTTFRADNQIVGAVHLDISGDSCDASPPELASLTLDRPGVSNVEGGTIEIRAIMSDAGCGAASLSGQAVPPNGIGGQRAYFSLEPQGDGQTFVGRIVIKQHAAKGIWQIAWMQAIDKGLNLRAYSANDPVIARTTFRVD